MTKFIGKKKRIYIAIHETVGAKANEISSVWNMGFNKFDSDFDGTRTYRIVYYKNKRARYYCQISVPIRKAIPQTDCAWK